MSFNMAVSNIAFRDSQFSDWDFDYGYSRANITLLGSFVIFVLLALYLTEILPNEMGTHKHPLFFLGIGRKAPQNELQEQLIPQN
jgi:hypothetical protein